MEKFRKRIVGAVILFLMMMLAIGTMVSYAEEGSGTSYKLTIRKVFAEDVLKDPDALAAAKNITYTFHVEGQVVGSDVPVEKTVQITGDGEKTISFGNAFKISVIEQTDDNNDSKYDVTGTSCKSSMHVSASQAIVNISKDGGTIEVTRPEGVPEVTFRLTGKTIHGGTEISRPDVTVGAGETKELGTGLPQGQYTITKLRSADGFSVLVGERSIDVEAGKSGVVHINGSDSKLSIKAPDSVDGISRTHHYHISGVTIKGELVSRDVDVRSGETAIVDHLTEGDYSVKVSGTYDGVKGYTIKFPETISEKRGGSYKVISTTTAIKKGYVLVGGDYIDNLTYGPLFDSNGKRLDNTVKYKFIYGAINPDDVSKTKLWGMSNYAKGGVSDNPVNLTGKEKDIVRMPYDNKLHIGTKEVSSSKASSMRVSWIEYTRLETERFIKNPAADDNLVTIDERGWISLSKVADADPLGKKVAYYYTITDANGANITGFTVTDSHGNAITNPTDKDGTTVMLRAGESVKIEGLHKGNFHIEEMVEPLPVMGFTVKLEDTTKTVTSPEGIINIEILGTRPVYISRPGKPEDDNRREYTYNIYEYGKGEPVKTIKLLSGGTTTVQGQTGSMLPPGRYQIKAMDDQVVGFDVTFSDSSSLVSDYIKEATVAFTNQINEVKASYHVIHEYYLENDDGTYTFEGASPVYTKNCDGKHNDKVGHLSNEVHLLDVHGGHTYTHIENGGDAYGKVVSWRTGSAGKDVSLSEEEKKHVYNGLYINDWKGSSAEGTYQYAYVPLDNMKFAEAVTHQEAEQNGGAQIIILRYVRKDIPDEHGKYNIIHVYYQRTNNGDMWEGSRELEKVDAGRLTNDNRYITYDADSVEKKLRFVPISGGMEYPYVYAGAAYGRIGKSDNIGGSIGENSVGEGKEYRKDDTMSNVKATEEGDQIIILRYYRGGAYNVVHEYYYQEEADFGGDSGEAEEEIPGEAAGGGTMPIADANSLSGNDPSDSVGDGSMSAGNGMADPGGSLNHENDADVESEFSAKYSVSGNNISEVGNVRQRKENSVSDNNLPEPDFGNCVDRVEKSAEEYSSEDTNSGISIDVVREGENDVSGNNPPAFDEDSNIFTGNSMTVSGNDPDVEAEVAAYSDKIQTREGEEDSFGGTLTDSDKYIYTFEGNREIVPYSADLESRHEAKEVEKENSFRPPDDEQYTYVFKDAVYGYVEDRSVGTYRVAPYKTGVTATAQEDEIIILRYVRGDGVKEPEEPVIPEIPEEPNPPGGGGGGGGGDDPDPTPPPEEQEIQEVPELPTELPDPNDPNSPEKITIWEDGVPKTYVKVWDSAKLEWIYIPEEEVPLWGNSPGTGDENRLGFWVVLAAGSLCGLIWLKFGPKKEEDS